MSTAWTPAPTLKESATENVPQAGGDLAVLPNAQRPVLLVLVSDIPHALHALRTLISRLIQRETVCTVGLAMTALFLQLQLWLPSQQW